ncbi:hypothetical protein TEA_003180 [Camellia sinensis var. sinensis]|uniref:Uncharacterized protein n=1 Tax=Camellia sinensis var. sinensis TaxID=542762 RepID=A0A4S4DMZ3_CAMSN|nr:hypothetical protein TEA_003180 [Camellia sinensis var. sinensis]
MLLRNSSTPLVQSLFSDTPTTTTTTTTVLSSVYSELHHPHHIYPTSLSCNSSPIYSWSSDFNRKTNKLTHKAFRRARSDGNLEGLASTSFGLHELCNSNKSSKLQAPSFSIYASNDGSDEENGEKEGLEMSEVLGIPNSEFSFGKKGMGLIEENDGEEEGEEVLNEFQDLGIREVVEPASPPMYLATGLGIGRANASAGNVEEYYKRMVGEEPSNPLFLRNCAQLLQIEEDDKVLVEVQKTPFEEEKELVSPSLHLAIGVGIDVAVVGGIDGVACNAADFGKASICSSKSELPKNESKRDLQGTEQYYSSAVLADPADGEIISQYAKVVWELHHDQDKAMSYFERAVQATAEDSHILTAYANFLWQTEEDEEEDGAAQDHIQAPLFLGTMTAANV